MDEFSRLPRAWLRRIDFALAASPEPAALSTTCPGCATPLEATPSGALAWCNPCRHVYFHAANRLLCVVPDHWRQENLFDYWERAMEGSRAGAVDLAFTHFLCRRLAASVKDALEEVNAPRPDQIRLGRLALAHRLLARSDVAWVLRFQHSARSHRRRCFGEIATSLGLWRPNVAARLLAVQAERRRGLARAVAERLGLSAEAFLASERAFFGLEPDRSCDRSDAPFDALMAA